MANRFSEIVIQFRCPPHLMFPLPPGESLQCNRLSIRLQPNEGIRITFQTKVPDRERELVLRDDAVAGMAEGAAGGGHAFFLLA